MQRIDLLRVGECEPEAGPHRMWCETPEFHANEWRGAKEAQGGYPSDAMHKRVLHPLLLDCTPAGSQILEVGAGARPRPIQTEDLRDRKLSVLSIAYGWPESESPFHDWVRADLRRLPFQLLGDQSLRSALESLLRHPFSATAEDAAIQQGREEIAKLLHIIQQREVGSCLFAHVLRYLPQPVRERLLRTAAKTVMPGGSVVYCERPKCMETFFPQLRKDYGTQPAEFTEQMQQEGLRIERDTLYVPTVRRELMERLKRTPGTAAEKERVCMSWITGGAASITALPGVNDDGSKGIRELADGSVELHLSGIRCIVAKRQ